MKVSGVYYLKGEGSMNWARFEIVTPDQIRVLALLSWTSYIDRDMTAVEARETWRELKERGWTLYKGTDTPPSEYVLKLWAYD